MPGPDGDTGGDFDSRLTRAEESLGFTDRTVEQLSAEIAAVNKRLAASESRLRALEARLMKLSESADERPD